MGATTLKQLNFTVTRSCEQTRQRLTEAREQGLTVGLVPTMGALHEGHLSLVRAAQQKCDLVAVSIFVNPTQFGPQEDLDRYPRPLDDDLQLLQLLQVDLVFTPDNREIYPAGFSTFVRPPRVGETLEGQFRPGHFQGVATVVLKLLHIMPADWVFFGQKDYQQCLVIRDLVRDLNLPIRLQFCPTVREPDGLALSSRNQYLSREQRQRALGLSRGLQQARQLFQSGERDTRLIEQRLRETLLEYGVDHIDYAAVRDPETLMERSPMGDQAIALLAAHVGQTRLIDNLRLD